MAGFHFEKVHDSVGSPGIKLHRDSNGASYGFWKQSTSKLTPFLHNCLSKGISRGALRSNLGDLLVCEYQVATGWNSFLTGDLKVPDGAVVSIVVAVAVAVAVGASSCKFLPPARNFNTCYAQTTGPAVNSRPPKCIPYPNIGAAFKFEILGDQTAANCHIVHYPSWLSYPARGDFERAWPSTPIGPQKCIFAKRKKISAPPRLAMASVANLDSPASHPVLGNESGPVHKRMRISREEIFLLVIFIFVFISISGGRSKMKCIRNGVAKISRCKSAPFRRMHGVDPGKEPHDFPAAFPALSAVSGCCSRQSQWRYPTALRGRGAMSQSEVFSAVVSQEPTNTRTRRPLRQRGPLD